MGKKLDNAQGAVGIIGAAIAIAQGISSLVKSNKKKNPK